MNMLLCPCNVSVIIWNKLFTSRSRLDLRFGLTAFRFSHQRAEFIRRLLIPSNSLGAVDDNCIQGRLRSKRSSVRSTLLLKKARNRQGDPVAPRACWENRRQPRQGETKRVGRVVRKDRNARQLTLCVVGGLIFLEVKEMTLKRFTSCRLRVSLWAMILGLRSCSRVPGLWRSAQLS